MDNRGLFQRASRGDVANNSFTDFVHLVEAFGFILKRIKGSHHVFWLPGTDEILSLQPDGQPGQGLLGPGSAQTSGGEPVGIERITMHDYHINVFYSVEDRCYIADIPDLKGCSAHGPSAQQALAEVLIAKEAWLEVAREVGRSIPEPTYRPAVYVARY